MEAGPASAYGPHSVRFRFTLVGRVLRNFSGSASVPFSGPLARPHAQRWPFTPRGGRDRPRRSGRAVGAVSWARGPEPVRRARPAARAALARHGRVAGPRAVPGPTRCVADGLDRRLARAVAVARRLGRAAPDQRRGDRRRHADWRGVCPVVHIAPAPVRFRRNGPRVHRRASPCPAPRHARRHHLRLVATHAALDHRAR